MAKQRPVPPGKTRTRQHIIADLAVNHLERHILQCGHTVERVRHDYGYDITVSTYDEGGRVESGVIFFQVKATDELPLLKDDKTISWPVSRRDLKLWLDETYPVVLVVYDGLNEKAYWLDVQEYIISRSDTDVFASGQTMHCHIPLANRVSRKSMDKIAQHKRLVHRQLRKRRGRHA